MLILSVSAMDSASPLTTSRTLTRFYAHASKLLWQSFFPPAMAIASRRLHFVSPMDARHRTGVDGLLDFVVRRAAGIDYLGEPQALVDPENLRA
jgi:hypothetical protein